MTTYLDVIQHYQRSIEKASNDETRLLHCIDKLYRLPVTVEHLQQTGIGKTVNSLRKYDKEVGVAAKALVAKWKAMVAAEEDIVEDEDTQKVDDDDQSNDDNDKYNGSHNGENSHNNHKHKQSSNRNDKSSDSDSKDKRHREKGREGSRDKRHSSSDSKRINNIVSDRHNHDKNINSSSKSHKDKHASNDHHRNDKHNRDRRNEEKFKSSSNHSSKKARSPEPIHESPTHMSDDDNFYDDDDEDEEKLVIDTENNKEKVEQSTKHSSSDSSKSSSKSSSHHKSKSSSKERSDKEREKSKTESTRTSSSSKSHSSDKVNNHKHEERHRHKSDKKDHDKSSHRSNGDHKSSSSSSKSKHHEKPKEDEKKNSSSSSSKESSSKSHSKSSSSKSDSHKSSKEKHKSSHDKSDSSSSKSSKRKHESADDSNSEEEQTTPKKAKTANKQIDGGIDSSMGKFSFEEALGLMAPPSKSSSKLKSPKMNGTASSASSSSTTTPTKSESSTQHSSKKIDRSKTPPLLTAKAKLEPLDPKLSLELPTISNNYKPLPLNPAVMDCVFSNNVAKPPPPKRVMSDAEALQSGIQSKTIRTKIYSGMKTGQLLQVPTLFQLCIRVLQKNIDGLEYTGGVPFEVLKPVLELATPEQLQSFEEYNPYLLEDTDDLWRIHCGRRYKTQKREELESWREMFVRCKEKEEERLSLLTKNITFQQKQISAPVRRTQLAYVDIDVKAPRNIQRKQEQYGTKGKMAATPAARVEALAKIAPTVAKAGDIRLRIAAETRDTAQASSHSRPKKAPLMQKTLQLMRGRFKR